MSKTTYLVDARSLDEIKTNGYWKPQKTEANVQWIHAQCTLEANLESACPLLAVASDSLIPDKSAPVIVYCASGKRSTLAKELLESKGYTNVLNAGGYPGDTDKIPL